MLPERLSTDLCSLVPGQDRPVYAIRMVCTQEGEVEDYEVCEGVIHNRRRFTYADAQAAIDGKLDSPQTAMLQAMDRFAKTLRKNRIENGSMDFYVPEVEFEMDEAGVPKRLYIKEILDSNNLVEEFMLLANKVAARHVRVHEKTYGTSLPYLYRVHEVPSEESIFSFSQLAKSLGCPRIKEPPGTSRWFQRILEYFSDKPEKLFIEEIALRSMMKAVYDSKNIGHFGLGFKDYSHFTSPIRRYPDLMLHRLMKKYGSAEQPGDLAVLKRRVTTIARHSSDMEVRSMGAEREAVRIKQVEYMADKVGDVFRGIISGVTSFGIFVKLEDILAEGLVHIRDLYDDFYLFDDNAYRLVGQRSHKVYKIGDRITVQVVKVDPDKGQIDFVTAGD